MLFVSRFWEQAAGILETAASGDSESDIAIVVDPQNCLRIMYGSGWNIQALDREFQASAAYTITRTSQAVMVEAQSGSERCMLRKSTGTNPLAILANSVPHHLVSRSQLLLQ